MPTDFLAKQYNRMLHDSSGLTTVSYIEFDASSRDSLTGDIDEDLAYAASPIELPARVSYYSSNAVRRLASVGISFDASVRFSAEDLTYNGVELKVGDAIILTDRAQKRYIVKITDSKQSGTTFIEKMVYVSSEVGHRG